MMGMQWGCLFLTLTLCACTPEQASDTPGSVAPPAHVTPKESAAPAGSYVLDKAHASLIFRVNHLGFSNYTARFKGFDAQLQFDPAKPETSQVAVTVDARSIETDFPDPAQLDFNTQLRGPEWLDATAHPEMTFRSTRVELTSPDTMRVTGDLTLRGVTHPIVMEATFNGGYAGHPMDPQARIGFSARTTFRRSEFGMTLGVPEPGSTMGVGDEVEVLIEAEFNGPPMPPTETPAT